LDKAKDFFVRPLKTEDFLMSLTASIHANKKAGTCPHGMPIGACPICNGISGGNSTSRRDVPRNAGEMTYNQCAAIGAMLKAQKHAKEQMKTAQQNRLQALAEFSKNISNTHQRLMTLNSLISNSMPAIIAKPISLILTTTAKILSIIQNIPNVIINVSQAISQKFTEISDKLTAIYGEFKAAVQEKFSKFISGIKKKFKSLFFIFSSSETDDEEKKIEEAKRTFELKTFIHKLAQKLKQQDTKNDEH